MYVAIFEGERPGLSNPRPPGDLPRVTCSDGGVRSARGAETVDHVRLVLFFVPERGSIVRQHKERQREIVLVGEDCHFAHRLTRVFTAFMSTLTGPSILMP